MVILKGISKSFGDKILYSGLDLEIEKGKITALVGKSGSGKSTLLNIIGAIEPPDKGSVIINNVDITSKKKQLEYLRSVVGFLFQNFALIENKTVRENLSIVHPRYREDISFDNCLAEVGLYGKLDEKVCSLLGGEQQRVALARLLLKKCQLVLADEPTGSLDKENAEMVFSILRSMSTEHGKTVIIVTHDMCLAQKCDTIIDLDNIRK